MGLLNKSILYALNEADTTIHFKSRSLSSSFQPGWLGAALELSKGLNAPVKEVRLDMPIRAKEKPRP